MIYLCQNRIDEITFLGLPELSLSLSTSEGEVVLVGCSHSSVQNIVADSKTFTNQPVHLVYGGYHMLPYGRDEISTVANRLKNELEVEKIAPTRCTGHLAFKLLKDVYGVFTQPRPKAAIYIPELPNIDFNFHIEIGY